MCSKLQFMQKIHKKQNIKCLNKNGLNVTHFSGLDIALILTRSSLNTICLTHSGTGLLVFAGTWLPSSPWDLGREVQPIQTLRGVSGWPVRVTGAFLLILLPLFQGDGDFMWLHIRTLHCDQDWNQNLISRRALGRPRLPASRLRVLLCTLTRTDLIKLQLQTEERTGDAFKNSERLSSPYPCSSGLIPTHCSAKGDIAGKGNEAKISPDLWRQSSWFPESRAKVLLLFLSTAGWGGGGVQNARIGTTVTRLKEVKRRHRYPQAPEGTRKW